MEHLKVRDVARLYQVDGSTVRAWLRSGALPAIRTPGGQYRIDKSAVDKFLAQLVADEHKAQPA